ncbi:class I SAM-dependent methyltransferase [Candidatus Omnitrophota bacterium]
MKSHSQHLKEICEQAMKAGLEIDLSDCLYGETTGSCAFIKRPTSYYFFLSGFVMTQRLPRILEIGTNYGGSIMSISKGLHEDDVARSQLVTVDVVRKNEEGFKKYPHINRIQGDSLDEEVVSRVTASFEGDIDLLYIDSLHEYEHTKENINIYTDKLNPRYVILDDIRQCDDMEKLWDELEEKFGDNAFDASYVSMRTGAGFGIIRSRCI